MKSQFSFTKAVFAGITGTIIMTLFTYMGGMMNIKMNVPEMLAGAFGGKIFIGWIMHFMIGTALALNYGLVFYSKFNIIPFWLRGAVFGIIPWLMAQVVVMPMMSMMNGMTYSSGLFSGSMMLAAASLVGHLIYGAVVGSIYKPGAKLVTAQSL